MPLLKFKEETLREALKKVVVDGMPMKTVSSMYHLNMRTLKSYLDKYHNGNTSLDEMCLKPNFETNQIFTNELENKFEEYMLSMAENGHTVTRDVIRSNAFKFALKCKIHVPKSWNEKKQAGIDWMRSYLKRHPVLKQKIVPNNRFDVELSYNDDGIEDIEMSVDSVIDVEIINPAKDDDDLFVVEMENEVDFESDYSTDDESTFHVDVENAEENQVIVVTTEDECVKEDYDVDFKSYMDEMKSSVDEFIDNLTEAYCTVFENNECASKNIFSFDTMTLHNDKGESLLTACCVFNAAGEKMSPFYIVPSAAVNSSFVEHFHGVFHPQAALNETNFTLFLRYFQKNIKSNTSTNKIALILPDSEYCVSIDSMEFCQENGIELVTVPGESVPNLMPFRNKIFSTINAYFVDCNEKSVRLFYMSEIITLLSRIFDQVIAIADIRNSFAEIGLCPLDQRRLLDAAVKQTNEESSFTPVITEQISMDFSSSVPVVVVVEKENQAIAEENAVAPNTQKLWCEDKQSFIENIFGASSDNSLFDEFVSNLKNALLEICTTDEIRANKIYSLEIFDITIATDKRVSICCIVNADGESLPPYVTFPEGCFTGDRMRDAENIEARLQCTSDQIRSPRLMQDIFNHFTEYTKCSREKKLLLLMYASVDSFSIDILDFISYKGIALVTVPESVIGSFLPLDKSAFQMMKNELGRQYSELKKLQLSERGLMDCFAENLFAAIKKHVVKDVICDGYKKSGLWPLNPQHLPNVFSNTESSSCESQQFGFSTIKNDEVEEFYQSIADFVNVERKNNIKGYDIRVEDCLYLFCEIVFTIDEFNCVTLCLFFNATGHNLPPYVILSNDLMLDEENDDDENSSLQTVVMRWKSGNVDDELFADILQHISSSAHRGNTNDRRLMLVCEPKKYMTAEKVAQRAQDEFIDLVMLPEDDFSILDPISTLLEKLAAACVESSAFSSLRSMTNFLEANLPILVNSADVVRLFNESFLNVVNENLHDDGSKTLIDDKSRAEDYIFEEEIEADEDETYCCSTCLQSFDDFCSLEEHVTSFRCRFCELAFCDELDKLAHELFHRKSKTHQLLCLVCGANHVSKIALIEHTKMTHSKTLF